MVLPLAFSFGAWIVVVSATLTAIVLLGGIARGLFLLFKGSVSLYNRFQTLTQLAETELRPNSGSSMKDAVTKAAADSREALDIAKSTQTDVTTLKDQFMQYMVDQNSEQQSQWAQIRKIGNV